MTPRIALEVAREVERVGAEGSGSDRDDEGLETVDRGETRAHFGDQIVLRHEKKVPAGVLWQTIYQFPLVFRRAAL